MAQRLRAAEQIRRHGEHRAERQCHQPFDDDCGWDRQAGHLVAFAAVQQVHAWLDYRVPCALWSVRRAYTARLVAGSAGVGGELVGCQCGS